MKPHTLAHHPLLVETPSAPALARAVRFTIDRFLLLPLGAAAAMIWANTAPESYFGFTHRINFFVNEVAMALFLALMVQEVLEALMPGGALHTWRRWAMPVIAAGGGIAGAAGVYLLYVSLKYEWVLAQAWPVACAIDVAACYYVLKLAGMRGPVLPFALLVGFVTDAVGLTVVALRPPLAPIQPLALLLMLAAMAVAWGLRRSRVRDWWPYFVVSGSLLWLALWRQGIHPALALVPIVPFLPREPRPINLFAERPDDDAVHHREHEWNEVVQIVLFLFGLVNGGVVLRAYGTGTWAVLIAGLAGRPLGILAAVALAALCGLHLPRHIGRRELLMIACATTSGFTFALFFATSLIATGPVLGEIKLGALATVAGAVVVFVLARTRPAGAGRHPGGALWRSS
jgi:NhaA family Na+:H+ antiporter